MAGGGGDDGGARGPRVETSRSYAIEAGGPERVELRWGASFREVRVLFDGAEITVLERKKLPRDGAKITLPDGSMLTVRLRGVLGIELLRDDVHLPGSDLEPRRLLRNAALLMTLAAVADGAIDIAMARQLLAGTPEAGAGGALPRALAIAMTLDAGLLLLAVPTWLGSRIALGVGIAAFASRFGLGGERSTWTLFYGLITTWLLATHFFGTFKRRG
jgi:hypothetical protein